MELQDNKQLALQKAISAHEQAAATLIDLAHTVAEQKHAILAERIEQNLRDLHAEAAEANPEDQVE